MKSRPPNPPPFASRTYSTYIARSKAVHGYELADLVELRYFAGMTINEVATTTGVGVTLVKESWSFAKAWLPRDMRESSPPPAE